MKTAYLGLFGGATPINFQATSAAIAALQAKLDAIAAGGPDEWFVIPGSSSPERRVKLSAVSSVTITTP